MHKLLLVFLVPTAAFTALAPVRARSYTTISPQQCVSHVGDDPAWAAPSLDESGWQPYTEWKPRLDQTSVWVRCHADLGPLRGVAQPAIQISLYASYQLYLQGKLLGGSGDLHNGNFSIDSIRSFRAPAELLEPSPATLALRVTYHSALVTGGPIPALMARPMELRAGDEDILDALRARTVLTRSSSYFEIAACYGVIGVLGIMLLGLFFYDRERRELMLLSTTCLAMTTLRLNEFSTAAMLDYSLAACACLVTLGNLLLTATQYAFIWVLAGRRIPRAIWILISLAFLAHAYSGIDAVIGAFGPSFLTSQRDNLVYGISLPAHLVLSFSPFVAFWPYQAISRRMRPIAALCMLWAVADITWFTVQGGSHFLHVPGVQNLFVHWSVALIEVRGFTTAGVLAALLGLLFREQRQVTEERAMLAGEMASAREIQQYLIPEKLPPTPGLAIESVYQPSREVGGDFFQVLHDLRDASTLIIVGDVAGKGLQAGMLAALIVGAIRTAFKFTSDPGKILALLNDRLQGRGLVTCLALRIGGDGTAELANAGHLPPYLNGKELALDGALPLGAVPDVAFQATRVKLSEGESLLFVSDGVVEARNSAGELFGFERTAAISTESAQQIAGAAQAFGQEDDITVLTVARAPELEAVTG
ncbi:MAG: PP2C family protein-serine/threonine phosphatase [Terracidiphilus sp.]|jgi:hypothetical protein